MTSLCPSLLPGLCDRLHGLGLVRFLCCVEGFPSRTQTRKGADPSIADMGPFLRAAPVIAPQARPRRGCSHNRARLVPLNLSPQFTGKPPPTNQHSNYVVDKFVLTSCCNRVTWLVPSGRSCAKLRGHAMLRCMASRLRRTVAILTLARHPIESIGDEGGSLWPIPWPVGGVRVNASLSRGR